MRHVTNGDDDDDDNKAFIVYNALARITMVSLVCFKYILFPVNHLETDNYANGSARVPHAHT